MKNFNTIKPNGFTLVEVMMVIVIMGIITAIGVTGYSKQNQVLELNANVQKTLLALREAQVLGTAVRGYQSGASTTFNSGYGVYFAQNTNGFVTFADTNNDNLFAGSFGNCTSGNGCIKKETFKTGFTISKICAGSSSSCGFSRLDVVFTRPAIDSRASGLEAVIRANSGGTLYNYAKITLRSPQGTEKNIEIRSSGKIVEIIP